MPGFLMLSVHHAPVISSFRKLARLCAGPRSLGPQFGREMSTRDVGSWPSAQRDLAALTVLLASMSEGVAGSR